MIILKDRRISSYAFGSPKNLRQFNLASARIGFNGKENDNDVKGNGNQQDYGMRIYDPRLGRFLSVDPLSKQFVWNSTYSFAENDVIRCTDLDGTEKNIYVWTHLSDGSTMHKIIPWNSIFPGEKYGPKGAGTDFYYFDRLTREQTFIKHESSLLEELTYREEKFNKLNETPINVKGERGAPTKNTNTPTGEFDGNTNPIVSDKGGSGGYDRDAENNNFSEGPQKSYNSTTKKAFDKDGFYKLEDGTWQKDYDEGKLFKSKNGKDTTVKWSATKSTKNYNELTIDEKKELEKWTPQEK